MADSPETTDAAFNPTVALAYAVAALQDGVLTTGDDDRTKETTPSQQQSQQRATLFNLTPLQPSTNENAATPATAAAPPTPASASSRPPPTMEQFEEEAGRRLARSRERNREHARRTRLRKKAQLETLQSKVKGLEAERQVLKQKIEECSIASILLGLSGGEGSSSAALQARKDGAMAQTLPESTNSGNGGGNSAGDISTGMSVATKLIQAAGGKRKRFVSDVALRGSEGGDKPHHQSGRSRPLTLEIDGKTTVIGGDSGRTHVNWKTGVLVDGEGGQKKLTSEQLEALR